MPTKEPVRHYKPLAERRVAKTFRLHPTTLVKLDSMCKQKKVKHRSRMIEAAVLEYYQNNFFRGKK